MSTSKIVIIGVGDDGLEGLTAAARRTLAAADLILGTGSSRKIAEGLPGRFEELDPDVTVALDQVKRAFAAERPVMVSGGDPLFYGTARYFCDRLGKDRFEVVPHVSSMQLAFARIKESWEDAYLASLADKPLDTIVDRIRTAEKIGLFSSDRHPPAMVAKALLERGIDYFRAFVCENLGSPDERVTRAELEDLARGDLEFHPLHVLVLVRKPNRPDRPLSGRRFRRFGNPDEMFAQSQPKRELITRAEVRALALSVLDVPEEGIFWDIGAGSGSVAIEAARLATRGWVYAIEPEPTDLSLIQANCESFGVGNVRAILGRAPEALEGLPRPDAVFVGGTGRHVESILETAFAKLVTGGRLAVNVATVDGLNTALETLKRLGGEVSVWNIWIARGVEQFDRTRFDASSPTFLLATAKPEAPPD